MRGLRLFTGLLPVARKEGRATLLSPRLLIIAGILALSVLAGVYAIAPGVGGGFGTSGRVVLDVLYHEELNASRPALALFAVTFTGESVSDLEVNLVNLTSGQGPQEVHEVLRQELTNTSGWARFEGLWVDFPGHILGLSVPGGDRTSFTAGTYDYGNELVPDAGYLRMELASLGGNPDQQTLYALFIDGRGRVIEGADVFIYYTPVNEEPAFDPFREEPPGGWEPYWNGTTDERGFYLRPDPLGPGEYVVRAERGALNHTGVFAFFAPPIPSPLDYGPDGILAFAGLQFVPLILPVLALALSYDALARERSEGSLDILLSKPVTRTGVALGKLTGVFASMAMPVVVIFLSAAGLVWGLTGSAPTGPFLLGFLGSILLLLLVYTLLFLAVSAHARNLGHALLVSILFFLVFAFFWSLISFVVASIFASPGSVGWLEIASGLSLVSPSGLYLQLLSMSLPGLPLGFIGAVGAAPAIFLPKIVIASALWVALPLALFLLAMKYRVSEEE